MTHVALIVCLLNSGLVWSGFSQSVNYQPFMGKLETYYSTENHFTDIKIQMYNFFLWFWFCSELWTVETIKNERGESCGPALYGVISQNIPDINTARVPSPSSSHPVQTADDHDVSLCFLPHQARTEHSETLSSKRYHVMTSTCSDWNRLWGEILWRPTFVY